MIADNQINHALFKYNRLYDNRVQSKITAVEVDIKKDGELAVLVDVIREPDGIFESNDEEVKQGLEVGLATAISRIGYVLPICLIAAKADRADSFLHLA